jgi:hypothetical protein
MTEQNPNSNPLDAIKNEISASLNDKNKKTIPWNNIVITAVLGALTLVSLAQMAASVKIFNKLKGGAIPANASTGVPQNNSLESQPDMVGGC